MAVELPEPLQWVLLLLAGTRWPEQDEGQLREMADHWRKIADGLEHAAQAGDSAMKTALDGQQGGAAEALATHWAQFTTGKGTEQDPGYFPGTIKACQGMGDMLESMANSAETAKIQIIAQLGILAFEIATAEAEAPATAGVSLVQIPAEIAAGRATVMGILKQLVLDAAKHALKMGLQMGAINLMAQTIELAEGHRKSIDTKELGDAVKGGAISGAIGNQLGKELGAVGGKLLPKGAMESLGGKMVHGAATGVGTDVLTQLAMTGKVDTGSLLGSGLSGGAGVGMHAGAQGIRDHFNGPPKFAPEGGIGAPSESGSGGRQDGPPSSEGGGIGDPVPSGSGGRQDGPPSSDNSTYKGPDGSSSGTGHSGSLAPFGSDRPSGSGGGGSDLGSNRPSGHHESPSHDGVSHGGKEAPLPHEGPLSGRVGEEPLPRVPGEPAREVPLEPLAGEVPRSHVPSVEPLPHEGPLSGRVGEEPLPRVPSAEPQPHEPSYSPSAGGGDAPAAASHPAAPNLTVPTGAHLGAGAAAPSAGTTHIDGTRTASAPIRPVGGAPGEHVPLSPDDLQAPPSGADPRQNSGAQLPLQFGPVTPMGSTPHGSSGGGRTPSSSAPRPEPTVPRPSTPGGGRGAGDHITEPSGSRFRTQEQRQRQQEREQRQHEFNTREHTTPETPVEPKRDVPTMGQQERLHTLDNLTPEGRRSLAKDKEFVAELRKSSTPDEFAESAAHLLVHVDPRTVQGGAARHEAHQQLARMLRNPEVAERLLNNGVEVVVVPKDVRMTDVPAFAAYKGKSPDGESGQGRGWDDVRGAAGRKVAITEENLLGETTEIGDSTIHADGYSSTTHEFAHAIHRFGLSESQDRLVTEAFNEKKARPDNDPENPVQWPDGTRPHVDGEQKDNYSSIDKLEYFAQASNTYLSTNHGEDLLTGQDRNNGAHWAGAHEQALRPLLEELYGKDPLAAHTGGRANPVDHTEAVSGVGDFFRMAEGQSHDSPAPHEEQTHKEQPHEEQPHPAAPHDPSSDRRDAPAHEDDSWLSPSPPTASPASGEYSHKIDGTKTVETIEKFVGSDEFKKVRPEIAKYERADLEDGDTAAMLAGYRQQKHLHVDLLSRNSGEFPHTIARLEGEAAKLQADHDKPGVPPEQKAAFQARKEQVENSLSRVREQQDRMAIFEHEHLKDTLKGPELAARAQARHEAEVRVLPGSIDRIKVEEARVKELREQAEQHRKAAAPKDVGVFNDRIKDLELRRKELEGDREQREKDLEAAKKAPLSSASATPAGGPRKGGVLEPATKQDWKKLDDSYRKAFGYSDHGVMGQEPHAEKLVTRSDKKAELAQAKVNRNHVIADYMVHKYVTAAVFKARSLEPEFHRAASEAFGDFATDLAPDRHRIYDKFGADAEKRLAMGGQEESALVRRDLGADEHTVDLGATYGSDLGKAFDTAGVGDHAGASKARAELERQLGRSGLDVVAKPELDSLTHAVDGVHPTHPTQGQIDAVHAAVGKVEQKVKQQAVEDLALVNGVTGPRLLDDTAATLRSSDGNGGLRTPASRKRLAGQLDDLAARYEKVGQNPKALKDLATDLRSDQPKATPDQLKQLGENLPTDRAALRQAEVKQRQAEVEQRLDELSKSKAVGRKLEDATKDVDSAKAKQAQRQQDLNDGPQAVKDAVTALGDAEKTAKDSADAAAADPADAQKKKQAESDAEAKKKAAKALESAQKKLEEAPGKLAEADRNVTTATEAHARVHEVYNNEKLLTAKDKKAAARVAWAVADHELVGKQYGGAFARAGAGENHPAGMFDHALTAKVEDVPGLIEDITAKLSNSASNLRFGDETVNKWIQNFLDPHLVRDPGVLTAVAHGQLPAESLYSPHTADLLQAVHSLEANGLAPKELRDIMAPKTQADMENVLSSTTKKPSPSAVNIGDDLHILNDKARMVPVSSSGDFANRPGQLPGPLPAGSEALPKPPRDPQAGLVAGAPKRDVSMRDPDSDTDMLSAPSSLESSSLEPLSKFRRLDLGGDTQTGDDDFMSPAPPTSAPGMAHQSGGTPRGFGSTMPSPPPASGSGGHATTGPVHGGPAAQRSEAQHDLWRYDVDGDALMDGNRGTKRDNDKVDPNAFGPGRTFREHGAEPPLKGARGPEFERGSGVMNDRGYAMPTEDHAKALQEHLKEDRYALRPYPKLSEALLGNVNPHQAPVHAPAGFKSVPNADINACLENVEALRDTHFGRPRVAGQNLHGVAEPNPGNTLWKRHDPPALFGEGPAAVQKLTKTVQDGGPGSFATVLGRSPNGGMGHAIALVNDGGTVRWAELTDRKVYELKPGEMPLHYGQDWKVWASVADPHEKNISGPHDPAFMDTFSTFPTPKEVPGPKLDADGDTEMGGTKLPSPPPPASGHGDATRGFGAVPHEAPPVPETPSHDGPEPMDVDHPSQPVAEHLTDAEGDTVMGGERGDRKRSREDEGEDEHHDYSDETGRPPADKRRRTPSYENTSGVMNDRGYASIGKDHPLTQDLTGYVGGPGKMHPPMSNSLLQKVNPHTAPVHPGEGFHPGADLNACLENVEAYRNTHFGSPRVSGQTMHGTVEPIPGNTLWKRHDGPALFGDGPGGVQKLMEKVQAGGPGTFATVLGTGPQGHGHAVALVHDRDGTLRWADLTDRKVTTADGAMPKNFGKDWTVWASVADPKENNISGPHDPEFMARYSTFPQPGHGPEPMDVDGFGTSHTNPNGHSTDGTFPPVTDPPKPAKSWAAYLPSSSAHEERETEKGTRRGANTKRAEAVAGLEHTMGTYVTGGRGRRDDGGVWHLGSDPANPEVTYDPASGRFTSTLDPTTLNDRYPGVVRPARELIQHGLRSRGDTSMDEHMLLSGGDFLAEYGHQNPETRDYWAAQDTRVSEIDTFADTLANENRPLLDANQIDGLLPPDQGAEQHAGNLLAQHEGFVLGENHRDRQTWSFLTQQMPELSASGVRTVYLEHFRDDALQADVAAFMGGAEPSQALTAALAGHERNQGLPPGSVMGTLIAAREHDVGVQLVDGYPARRPKAPAGATTDGDPVNREHYQRARRMNAYAVEAIREHQAELGDGAKYVLVVGSAHVGQHQAPPGLPVAPGVSESLGVPGVAFHRRTDGPEGLGGRRDVAEPLKFRQIRQRPPVA